MRPSTFTGRSAFANTDDRQRRLPRRPERVDRGVGARNRREDGRRADGRPLGGDPLYARLLRRASGSRRRAFCDAPFEPIERRAAQPPVRAISLRLSRAGLQNRRHATPPDLEHRLKASPADRRPRREPEAARSEILARPAFQRSGDVGVYQESARLSQGRRPLRGRRSCGAYATCE